MAQPPQPGQVLQLLWILSPQFGHAFDKFGHGGGAGGSTIVLAKTPGRQIKRLSMSMNFSHLRSKVRDKR